MFSVFNNELNSKTFIFRETCGITPVLAKICFENLSSEVWFDSCFIIYVLCYVTLRYVTLRDVTLRYVICCVMLCLMLLCYVMLIPREVKCKISTRIMTESSVIEEHQ